MNTLGFGGTLTIDETKIRHLGIFPCQVIDNNPVYGKHLKTWEALEAFDDPTATALSATAPLRDLLDRIFDDNDSFQDRKRIVGRRSGK